MPDKDKQTRKMEASNEDTKELSLFEKQISQFSHYKYNIRSVDNGWVVDIFNDDEREATYVFETMGLLQWLASEFGIEVESK